MNGYQTIPQRTYKKEDRSFKIVNYGLTNAYPQMVDYAISGCSIADSCCEVLAEFVQGNGFVDLALNELEVNSDNQTLFDILAVISDDYARFGGYALHFNYNLLGEIVSIHHVPFTYCRLGLPSADLRSDYVRVWDNWANESIRQNTSSAEIKTYYRYNPDRVLDQIEECEGIGKYTGQILYWTDCNGFYPKSSIDSCFEQVLTFGQLAEFSYNFVKNGFSASTVFIKEEISPDDETFERNIEQIKSLSGSRSAGGIGYLEGKISSLPVTLNEMNKQYEVIKEGLKDDIIEKMRVPPVLVSRTRQGGFPNQDEIINSFDYYNGVTEKYRRMLSRSLKEIMQNWVNPIQSDFAIAQTVYNSSNEIEDITLNNNAWNALNKEEQRGYIANKFGVDDIVIQKSKEKRDKSNDNESNNPEQATAQAQLRGSVGGVQGILSIADNFKRGIINELSATTILEEIYGFSEQVAREILGI
jgi:hypothetical protein